MENIPWNIGQILASVFISLCWLIYKAREVSHISCRTTLGEIRLNFSFSNFEYLYFVIGNILIFVLTLTTGWAFLQRRQFEFWQDHLVIKGEADFALLHQAAEAGPKTGEGLVDVFGQEWDVGFDVGL